MNATTSRSAWIGKTLSFPPVPCPMTSGSGSCRASCTRIAIDCRRSHALLRCEPQRHDHVRSVAAAVDGDGSRRNEDGGEDAVLVHAMFIHRKHRRAGYCAGTYVGSCVALSITEPYAATRPVPPVTSTLMRA